MKKQIILSLLLCLLITINMQAQAQLSEGHYWEETTDRSQTIFSLSIENDILHISSNKTINNITVSIKDTTGNIIYQEEIQIHADQSYSIYLGQLQSGTYIVELQKGDNYMVRTFDK